jgi:hypothetical protein
MHGKPPACERSQCSRCDVPSSLQVERTELQRRCDRHDPRLDRAVRTRLQISHRGSDGPTDTRRTRARVMSRRRGRATVVAGMISLAGRLGARRAPIVDAADRGQRAAYGHVGPRHRSRRRMTSAVARRRVKRRMRTMVKAQDTRDAGVERGRTAPPIPRGAHSQMSSARTTGVSTSRQAQ